MGTSKQRKKVKDFATLLDQENVSGQKLPSVEEVDWSAEDIAQLEKCLAEPVEEVDWSAEDIAQLEKCLAEPVEEVDWSEEDIAQLEKCLAEPVEEVDWSEEDIAQLDKCLAEPLPSSAPDGRLLLGTRSAPIEIPDSPGRENSGRNEISNGPDRKNTLNQEGTQRMDNFKQRNEIKDFMATIYHSNVCDHELPTFEELAWTADEIDELDQYMTGVGESSHSQVIKKVGPRRSCKPGCTHCQINRLSNLHTNPRNQWWFDIAIKKPGGNIGSGWGISQPSLKIPEHPLSNLSKGTNLSEFHRDNVPFRGSCQEDTQVLQSPNCISDRACGNTASQHSTKLYPSASALGETLLLGTKFAPIEIPDSLDSENSSDQGQQESQRSNKGKRLREPEPIVQVQCSSPSNKAKRVKMLHESQNKASTPIPQSAPLNAPIYASPPERTEIEIPSIQIGSDGTHVLAIRHGVRHLGGGPRMGGSINHLPSELGSVLLPDSALIHQRNEGELQSIEANVDGIICKARSDGVDYMDGCIVIPQGRDMVLEDLLGEPNVDGNARSDGVDYMDGCIVIPQGRDMVLQELLGEP